MIYRNIDLIAYDLELNTKLENSQLIYRVKKGYILKLYIDDCCGCGEVCLLENYSKENLKQIMWAFEEIKIIFISGENYSKEEFLNIFKIHSASMPSFNFALDIALYDILSQQKNVSIAKYITPAASDSIKICGIYINNNSMPVDIVKVKLLCQNVDDDIDKILDIIKKYNGNILLRLDANRGYDINEAIKLCNSIDLSKIQYFEEPLRDVNCANFEKFKMKTGISIAMDETFYEDDYKLYIESYLIDYVILKPSIFGSIKKILDFKQYALKYNLKIVLSSSLENYIGNLATVHIASALQIEETTHGINNLLYYDYSDKVFYNKEDSIINIKDLVGLGICFDD